MTKVTLNKDAGNMKITPGAIISEPGSKILRIAWPECCANEPIAPFHRKFLEKIEADILAVDPSLYRDEGDFQTAVVVIVGGTIVGPFADRIVALTGFPRAMVDEICKNMCASGLWKDLTTSSERIEDAFSASALWCHVLVAQGLVIALWDDEKGTWSYQAAPVALD